MATETVIVFKDKKSREIRTFVNLEGHGAGMELEAFIDLVAELYGSPATTMTRAGFLKSLQDAAARAVRQMKSQTREVAAVTLEAKK